MNPRAGRGTLRYTSLEKHELIDAIKDLELLVIESNRLEKGIQKALALKLSIEKSLFKKYGNDLEKCLSYLKSLYFDRFREDIRDGLVASDSEMLRESQIKVRAEQL